MKIREFLGSTVLDKNANEVGKVDNVEFNPEDGKIEEKVEATIEIEEDEEE